jgi:hypothetical protein
LLELSEYLIPNGAWLKLPSRFKKPFQFLFQFLHPTHLRASSKPVLHERAAASPAVQQNWGNLFWLIAEIAGSLVSKYSSANRFIPVLA